MSLSSLRDRGLLTFGVGLALGAVLVLAAWAWGGSADAELADDPGIPPPEYAYLDNPRVLAYLAQIEGGLSTSEKRTRQVATGGTGGVAAGGVSVGASRSREEFVEQVVTPTATTRFYRLLDRLRAKSYLRELDAAARPADLASALGPVAEGEFVRISRCRLWTPTYATMLRQIRAGRAKPDARDVFGGVGSAQQRLTDAEAAAEAAGSNARSAVGGGTYLLPPALVRQWPAAARRYAKAVAADPRTAFASCRGRPSPRPHGIDLLVPMPLGSLAGADELLAGPVTIVGKVVRRVRTKDDVYVDAPALAGYGRGVDDLDAVVGEAVETSLGTELATDVTVLPPGAVVLPIAIYK